MQIVSRKANVMKSVMRTMRVEQDIEFALFQLLELQEGGLHPLQGCLSEFYNDKYRAVYSTSGSIHHERCMRYFSSDLKLLL